MKLTLKHMLAGIARERGKPASGLKDAILAAMTSRMRS